MPRRVSCVSGFSSLVMEDGYPSAITNSLNPLTQLPRLGIHSLYRDTSPKVFHVGANLKVKVMQLAEDGTFDLSQYEHYWTKEEKVPGLDLSQTWTTTSLLAMVRKLLSDRPQLLPIKFHPISQDSKVNGHASNHEDVIRVMQWNILAQGLSIGKDNFVRCPVEALYWDKRRLHILEEILTINPDILCLQEVDHFAFFKSTLSCVGYEGIFFPKPDSPALYVKDTNGPDGCAIFYKTDKLNMIDQDTIVLKTIDGVLYTNQVSVILKFSAQNSTERGKDFYVATTHLKAKNGWHELRHSQGSYLAQYLSKKVGDSPVIICGDFNAECTEPVYDSFKDSPLKLLSTYTLLNSEHTEPPYTTWKIRGTRNNEKDICRTIDYMWCSREKLRVRAIKLQPSPADIGEDRLPSFRYPSDHLSLAADYAF